MIAIIPSNIDCLTSFSQQEIIWFLLPNCALLRLNFPLQTLFKDSNVIDHSSGGEGWGRVIEIT